MQNLQGTGTSGGERADGVDHVLAGIARLSNEVKDAASYLPAYDQRTYSDVSISRPGLCATVLNRVYLGDQGIVR